MLVETAFFVFNAGFTIAILDVMSSVHLAGGDLTYRVGDKSPYADH